MYIILSCIQTNFLRLQGMRDLLLLLLFYYLFLNCILACIKWLCFCLRVLLYVIKDEKKKKKDFVQNAVCVIFLRPNKGYKSASCYVKHIPWWNKNLHLWRGNLEHKSLRFKYGKMQNQLLSSQKCNCSVNTLPPDGQWMDDHFRQIQLKKKSFIFNKRDPRAHTHRLHFPLSSVGVYICHLQKQLSSAQHGTVFKAVNGAL